MRKLFILLMMTLFAAAAASGAVYNIRIGILDSGGIKGASTNFNLLGKARERQLDTTSSTNFTIKEGFLKAVHIRPPILGPFITNMVPSSANNTGTVEVTVTGGNFAHGATVKLSLSGQSDIPATVNFISSATLEAVFNLNGAAQGSWTLWVTNPDTRSASLEPFTITAVFAPVITSITPNKGYNNAFINISSIRGSNFATGATVKLTMSGQSDIIANPVSVVPPSNISCRFDLTGKTIGFWDVVVTNPDTLSGTLHQGFTIEEPSLKIIGQVINYPNPFNPLAQTTLIKYTLSKDANITIYIYTTSGERIWQYSAPPGSQGGRAGQNEVVWNGITAFRGIASSGVYLVHVTARVSGKNVILSRGKIAIMK